MRLLVGTMVTIENEFEACQASIRRQTYQDFEQLVIRDLPNREAHEALYGTFRDRRDEFELLVKVDADMVVSSPTLFADVVERFQCNPELQVLSIAVHDYYSDRLVFGLNTYRNTIPWQRTGDLVFTDQFPRLVNLVTFDRRELAPAAAHCPDPSPFQAFHFGLHRGVKAHVAAARRMHGDHYARFQDIHLTGQHFLRTRDPRLGLAMIGAELALGGRFDETHLSYGNDEVEAVFNDYRELDAAALEREIKRLARANWGLLPAPWRREVLRRDYLTLPVRLVVPYAVRQRSAHIFGKLTQRLLRREASR
ncbi:MAG: hypothetical protein ABI333_16335 [bacterium]